MSNPRVLDVFASIFLLSQKLQYITDYELGKNGLTTKQFQVLAAADKYFDEPPSLNDVADMLATSHQNVKQLSNQLVKKGFVEYVKDPSDGRKVLLKTTEKNRRFWDSHAAEHIQFFNELFSELTQDEIEQLYNLQGKLMQSFDRFYTEIRG